MSTSTRNAIHTNAADSNASPVRTTFVVPTRSTIRGDNTDAIAMAKATGNVRTPASSGP